MHQSLCMFEILTAKVSEVQKPQFLKQYASSSGTKSIHMWDAVR
jgi:hypothetical protein